MASNNHEWSLLFGASIDESSLEKEFSKIKSYVNKSKDTTIEIKTLLNSDNLEKQVLNIRNLFDKISGEKIGESGVFKIGDKFVEIQRTLKGTIQSVELVQQSMKRLGDNIEPISSIEKKISSLTEKLNRLKESPTSFINQSDISSLDDGLKKINQIESTLNSLKSERTSLLSTGADKDELTELQEKIRELTQEQNGLIRSMEDGMAKVTNSSKDYKKELDSLTKDLKSQYSEANKLQKSLNNAYSSDNLIAIKKYQDQLKALEGQIKNTKKEITQLTKDSSYQKNLTAEYSSSYKDSKSEQKYAEQSAAVNKLNNELKELFSTETRLHQLNTQDAELHQREIDALSQKQAKIAEEIRTITQGSVVLQKYVDNQIKMQEISNRVVQAKAADTAATNSQKSSLSQYQSELKNLITIKEKEYKLDLTMKNNRADRTKENQALLSEYRNQISASEENLKVMESSNEKTRIGEQMTTQYAEAQKRLALSKLEANAEGKKEVSLLDGVTNGIKSAVTNVINYSLAMVALQKSVEFLKNSISVIYELNQSITDVQMVTGQSSSEIAKTASEYSKMAKELGSTTDQIASGASEWLDKIGHYKPF